MDGNEGTARAIRDRFSAAAALAGSDFATPRGVGPRRAGMAGFLDDEWREERFPEAMLGEHG